jgi:Mg-chelatase subunit ChlD
VTANRIQGTDEVHISLFVPESEAATMRTLFIDCLDTSGSMGSSSVDTTQGNTDAASFSRADLVQHSVATQIELLRPYDELAIIRFDDNAEILLEPTKMTVAGRARAKLCIPQIKPRGGTNIWAGLHKAYNIAARPENANKNIVIIIPSFAERYLSTALFEGL